MTATKTSFRVAERDAAGFSSDFLTTVFCYAFLAFSNVLFQGLLHIHALLDNPFGHHPPSSRSGSSSRSSSGKPRRWRRARTSRRRRRCRCRCFSPRPRARAEATRAKRCRRTTRVGHRRFFLRALNARKKKNAKRWFTNEYGHTSLTVLLTVISRSSLSLRSFLPQADDPPDLH